MTNSLDKAVLNHAFARIAKREERNEAARIFVYEAATYYNSAGRSSFAIRAVMEVAGPKEARAYREAYRNQIQTESREDLELEGDNL